MTGLSRRSTERELMDRADTPDQDYAHALANLAQVNRLTLTHRPVLRWLQAATRELPPGTALSVLDVACGHGDLLRAIHRWGAARGLRLALTGIDLNPRSTAQARAATPPGMVIAWRTGDVLAHVPQPAPDFIVTSQFTHHLDDPEILALLAWLERHARRGWYIADLHRHVVPYYGFRLLARVMGWHRIVRVDGTISIARGFRRAEWQALLCQAGLVAELRWHMMFRLCVGRLK
jgi:2-polyprenyl-3-methyl-5-hydroxy-6-metoxy-1,4-benzoquinol methylase